MTLYQVKIHISNFNTEGLNFLALFCYGGHNVNIIVKINIFQIIVFQIILQNLDVHCICNGIYGNSRYRIMKSYRFFKEIV